LSRPIVVVLGLALVATLLLAPTVPAAVGPAPVEAAGFSFTPALLIVPAGTTIQWDGVLFPHTVTTAASLSNATNGIANDHNNSDEDPDTFAALLPEGTSLSYAFTTPGDYAYYCELHRSLGMVGQVRVV